MVEHHLHYMVTFLLCMDIMTSRDISRNVKLKAALRKCTMNLGLESSNTAAQSVEIWIFFKDIETNLDLTWPHLITLQLTS